MCIVHAVKKNNKKTHTVLHEKTNPESSKTSRKIPKMSVRRALHAWRTPIFGFFRLDFFCSYNTATLTRVVKSRPRNFHSTVLAEKAQVIRCGFQSSFTARKKRISLLMICRSRDICKTRRVIEQHNGQWAAQAKLEVEPSAKQSLSAPFLRRGVRLQFSLCAPIVLLNDATFLQMTRLLQLARTGNPLRPWASKRVL